MKYILISEQLVYQSPAQIKSKPPPHSTTINTPPNQIKINRYMNIDRLQVYVQALVRKAVIRRSSLTHLQTFSLFDDISVVCRFGRFFTVCHQEFVKEVISDDSMSEKFENLCFGEGF